MRISVALAAFAALAGVASATPILISGSGAWGSFSGTLDYTFTGGSSGTLDISLTNTSDPGNTGFITAFAFNVGGTDAAATATLTAASDSDFGGLVGPNASPFGIFDAGASTSSSWTGGGSPSAGIAVGVTETFSFAITAADASLLSSDSFISAESVHFVVRFRGFRNGESDKVPGVPTPGSLALMGVSALAAGRRRR